jgi:hypothetical protein
MSKSVIKRQYGNNDANDPFGEKTSKFTGKGNYTRPEKTFTDNLSKEEIEKRLEDYEKVDDMFKVPLGVHMRYFTTDKNTGEKVFRMGGQLHHNKGLPKYVMLSNGTTQWSVQMENSIFFRKMTGDEIKEGYKEEMQILKDKYEKLKEKYEKTQNELKKYKNENEQKEQNEIKEKPKPKPRKK